jgi:murein DD-endopeptidase MepM/ murein hydrolase activator NlpD
MPLDGLTAAQFLARSLDYTPRDVVRDGLPHFGAARDDWNGRPRRHQGIDIYVDGHLVLAAAAGRVVGVGEGRRAGGWVKLMHGHGVETVYVHVRGIQVRNGDPVKAGQSLARVDGPAGNAVEPQLHFEIKLDGRSVDPVPFITAVCASPALRAGWETAVEAIPVRVAARDRLLRESQRHGKDAPSP